MSIRELLDHYTLFGKSKSLIIDRFFQGVGIADFRILRGLKVKHNIYRYCSMWHYNTVLVIEMIPIPGGQMLWIWLRDIERFKGTEFSDLTTVTEVPGYYEFVMGWKDVWLGLVNAISYELPHKLGRLESHPFANVLAKAIDAKKGLSLTVLFSDPFAKHT
ncbi:uncharacterized protein TRIVIDRAFT_67425 [Trichoderma virens Gv29-8]|uniref:Uncharacterized protein n=1 Tax=Hypocrea virens (strain Gv29-8 / FGSC 10586) TaxID=413071 RepID=G9N638_HYPVG|nr:uncharacterized protein TRIVIDRAFT_67425 [Trichoderma virens Gv29-8]EHK18229.1 hypothetical protein TRIVIDRAFT_67425 [Trichoderma virens Gv29-8]